MSIPELPFHPMSVHFPVALFLSAFVIEAAGRVLRRDSWHTTARHMFTLAAVMTLPSIFTGLEEAEEHGLKHWMVDLHRNLGIAVAFLSWFALAVHWLLGKKRLTQLQRQFFLVACCSMALLVSVTGYWGGKMAHDYDIDQEEE